MSKMLAAALAYAQLGWRVFPVKARSKQPLIQEWQKRATTDEATIRQWWSKWPDANIGMAAGPESGVLVLDQDGEEGQQSLAGLEKPPTPTQRTGGGGLQWFYAWDERLNGLPTTKVGLLPGVDTRGTGGFTILPPSLHPSGKRYAWADSLNPRDVPLAPPPTWLIQKLTDRPAPSVRVEAGAPIPEGQRNSTLASIAGAMRRRGLTAEEIEAALLVVNRRCVPPLDEREVSRIARSVARYAPAEVPRALRLDESEQDERLEIMDFRQAQQQYERYIEMLAEAKVTLGLPVLDEAMRGLAPGETLWIMARAGVGKTAFLLNILAYNSEIGVDSLFCTLEQPAAQIYERAVQIAVGQSGLDVESVFSRAMVAKRVGTRLPEEYVDWTERTWQRFQHVRMADRDAMTMEDVEAVVRAYERRYGCVPRILAIDYLGRMDGGQGSNYEVTSRLAKQAKSLAKALGVAVILIHQVSREGGDGSQEVSLHMARDSGQVEEAADFVLGLWRPDLHEAIKYKVAEERVCAALLKCRRGPLIRTEFIFDKPRMIFRPAKPTLMTRPQAREAGI